MTRHITAAVLVVMSFLALDAHAQPVRFSVTCDNRYLAGFADVLDEITLRAGGPGDFMVSPGDFDPCADTRDALDTAYGAAFTWYPVIGNHELPGAGQETYSGENIAYLRSYPLGPVNPGPAGCSETTYSFDAGPVHIACINEYWNGATAPDSDIALDGDVVEGLRQWLDDDLTNTDKRWKLVFGHEPAFPQPDEDWGDIRHELDSLNKYPANRDAFWALLEEHDVVAYICGHSHRFSHYQPPGSDVWQIDAAQAREVGKYDTFLIVTASEDALRFDAYRSLDTGSFFLTDSWAVPEPATLVVIAAGTIILAFVRRRSP